MFQIYGIAIIFCFQLWGNSETSKKTKCLDKDEIKKQLLESITINSAAETKELDEQDDKVEKLENAVDIIKKYEEILRTKRKGIIAVAFRQGKVFKHFKEKEKFIKMVGKLKIHKSTIIFKINLSKLIEKHPKLMKSSVTFLKNYFKYIKQICKGNSGEFE